MSIINVDTLALERDIENDNAQRKSFKKEKHTKMMC